MSEGYLLDTQVFVLAITRKKNGLPAPVWQVLNEVGNRLFLSVASIWEMAIKIEQGKLDLGIPLPDAVKSAGREAGVLTLAISEDHAYRTMGLPDEHRDPFDRLLAAQCLVERLPILSGDSIFDRYGCHRIWLSGKKRR